MVYPFIGNDRCAHFGFPTLSEVLHGVHGKKQIYKFTNLIFEARAFYEMAQTKKIIKRRRVEDDCDCDCVEVCVICKDKPKIAALEGEVRTLLAEDSYWKHIKKNTSPNVRKHIEERQDLVFQTITEVQYKLSWLQTPKMTPKQIEHSLATSPLLVPGTNKTMMTLQLQDVMSLCYEEEGRNLWKKGGCGPWHRAGIVLSAWERALIEILSTMQYNQNFPNNDFVEGGYVWVKDVALLASNPYLLSGPFVERFWGSFHTKPLLAITSAEVLEMLGSDTLLSGLQPIWESYDDEMPFAPIPYIGKRFALEVRQHFQDPRDVHPPIVRKVVLKWLKSKN